MATKYKRKDVNQILIYYHCANKRRVNDEHSYVRMARTYLRMDGGNLEQRKARMMRCSACGAGMVEGDAMTLGITTQKSRKAS